MLLFFIVVDLFVVFAVTNLLISAFTNVGALRRLIKVILIPVSLIGYFLLISDANETGSDNIIYSTIVFFAPVALLVLLLIVGYIAGVFKKEESA